MRPYATNIGFTAAFAVAVFARFYRLGDIPSTLHSGEDAFRRAAVEIMDHGWIGLWSEIADRQPTGIAYWLAGWSSLFGDGVATMRLLSAIVGLATIGVFYLFCRSLFGRRPAEIGSVLLALSAWHLGYSRLALPVLSMLLAELATAYFLFVAFRETRDPSRQRTLMVLGGLSLGIGVYTDNAFFIFAAVVALWWIRELLAGEDTLKGLSQKGLAFFIPALVVALPYLVFVALDPGVVIEKAGDTSVFSTGEFQDRNGVTEKSRYVFANTARTSRAMLWRRSSEAGGGRLLDPVTAFLAAVGLAVGLWHWRERSHSFVLTMAATTLVAAGLTVEAGTYGRLVVALPAIFAYAGYASYWLLGWMKGRVPDAAVYGLGASAVAFVGIYNLTSYFGSPLGAGDLLWQSGP